MYTFRTIQISDRKTIETIRLREGQLLSSHIFVSVFLWAEKLHLEICLEKDFYVIRRNDGFYFPCGSEEKKKQFIEEAVIKEKKQLLQMREKDIDWLEKYWPGQFAVIEDRDESEYIYLLGEQIRLVGSKYAQMRKELRHVLKKNGFEFRVITKEVYPDIEAINCKWREKHQSVMKLDEADLPSIEKAIQYFEELRLEGIVMYKEEKPTAYIISSRINEEVADIHFLKCIDRERGVELCCKQAYYCLLGDCYQYVNCEDDMGIEGLRTAKMEAHPIKINIVWKAHLREE